MSKLGGVTEEGTVVSNLPLLFADGLPTSLERITEKQLEKFIVLMLNCSMSREYFCLDKMPTPKWWPSDIPFSIPVVKPPNAVGDQWLWKLKSLVTRCYAYHACDFMLTFCHDLAKYPVEILKFVDLCDGTTSLLNKENGKLLVTFRNQNVIYDRKVESSPRKSLLPRGSKSSGGSKLMVQPPPFIDIYLCDSCDAEFETLKEVRDHERLCRQEQDQQRQGLRSNTPDDLQCLTNDQSKYLNYFGLCGLDGDSSPSPSSASPPRSKAYKRKCQGNLNFIRCATVPVSSPLGISMQKKMPRATYIVPQGHLDRVERYCLTLKNNARTSWSHLYENIPEDTSSEWVHTYSFTKRQRLSKYEALKIGLSERSIRLLKKCLHLEVSLTRLSEQQIAKLTRRTANKSGTKLKPFPGSAEVQPVVSHKQVEIPVIDLCSSDEEDSGISMCINSPDHKSVRVSGIESVSKLEDSCSSQFNCFQNLTLRSPLPIKYSNTSFSVCNLSKPISSRKRSRRGRRSLASENEIIPPTREQKKYIRNSFPLEGKSKLQELNQIKESSDAKSKEWFPPFITTSQTNHNGKKFSAAV